MAELINNARCHILVACRARVRGKRPVSEAGADAREGPQRNGIQISLTSDGVLLRVARLSLLLRVLCIFRLQPDKLWHLCAGCVGGEATLRIRRGSEASNTVCQAVVTAPAQAQSVLGSRSIIRDAAGQLQCKAGTPGCHRVRRPCFAHDLHQSTTTPVSRLTKLNSK